MMRPGSAAITGGILLVPFRATDVNQTALSIPGADHEDLLAAGRLLRSPPRAEEIVV